MYAYYVRYKSRQSIATGCSSSSARIHCQILTSEQREDEERRIGQREGEKKIEKREKVHTLSKNGFAVPRVLPGALQFIVRIVQHVTVYRDHQQLETACCRREGCTILSLISARRADSLRCGRFTDPPRAHDFKRDKKRNKNLE